MFRYPDGTTRQTPPARVEYGGYIRNFADLTPTQRDELGYNEAVPLKREPFTTYTIEWVKGGDLIYRKTEISAVVDEAARDAAEADAVRTKRDKLLDDSDWTQLADAALSGEEKAAWATKRQAWRDVPQQDGFPWVVTWPAAPA
jgi:hypothetical protein